MGLFLNHLGLLACFEGTSDPFEHRLEHCVVRCEDDSAFVHPLGRNSVICKEV